MSARPRFRLPPTWRQTAGSRSRSRALYSRRRKVSRRVHEGNRIDTRGFLHDIWQHLCPQGLLPLGPHRTWQAFFVPTHPRAGFELAWHLLCPGLRPGLCHTPSKNVIKSTNVAQKVVPRRGLEPPLLAEHGPEPCASTNSAIWAGGAHVSGRTAPVNADFRSSSADAVFRLQVVTALLSPPAPPSRQPWNRD